MTRQIVIAESAAQAPPLPSVQPCASLAPGLFPVRTAVSVQPPVVDNSPPPVVGSIGNSRPYTHRGARTHCPDNLFPTLYLFVYYAAPRSAKREAAGARYPRHGKENRLKITSRSPQDAVLRRSSDRLSLLAWNGRYRAVRPPGTKGQGSWLFPRSTKTLAGGLRRKPSYASPG